MISASVAIGEAQSSPSLRAKRSNQEASGTLLPDGVLEMTVWTVVARPCMKRQIFLLPKRW